MRLWWSGLLALLVLAGCHNGGTYVVVRLDRGAAATGDIVQVDLQLSLGGMQASVQLSDPARTPIAFPTEKALQIGKAAGALTVVAVARDASGAVVASAQGTGNVVRGETMKLDLTLGQGQGNDDLGGDDGPGAMVPMLTADKPSYDFGTAVTGMSGNSATFTVTNVGNASSGAIATTLGGTDAASFTLAADQCSNNTLAPGATCTVDVVFSPGAAGSKAAALTITGAIGGTASVTLTGSAVAPGALAAAPQSKDYSTVTIGSQSAAARFTMTNTGGVTSGAMTTTLSGNDASQFVVVADTCKSNVLMPSGTCYVDVAFKPTTFGSKSASLSVMATPGGTAIANVSGVGQTGASLAFTQNAGHDFSVVDVGMTSQTILQLTNGGQAASGAIATNITGNTGDFSVTDACNGVALTGGTSCNVTITFKPGSWGTKSLSVAVSASPGGTPMTTVTGTGRDALTLGVTKLGSGTGTVTAPGGGAISSGSGISCGSACSDSFYRTTTSPITITLTATPTAPATVTGWSISSCGTSSTCNVALSSTPTNVSVTFTLPTYTVSASTTGVGGGTGTVMSSSTPTPPQELDCGSGGSVCSVSMNAGTYVTLTARPDPGYYFAGWSGASCAGMTPSCSFTVNAARSATAKFSVANVVFVTNAKYTMAQVMAAGSGTSNGAKMTTGGDALCKSAAGAAGLRGTSYVSWIATSTSSAVSRLGATARGWVRSDGKPFGDQASGGFVAYTRQVFYPVAVDEKQTAIPVGEYDWTGVTDTGVASNSDNCTDFSDTTSTAYFRTGNPHGGSYAWSNEYSYPCNSINSSFTSFHLLCFGTDYSAVVVPDPPPPTARRLFIDASGYKPAGGLSGADAACNSEAANRGWSGTYTALLANWNGASGASAASRIATRGVPVYRPDNVLVAGSDAAMLTSGAALLATPFPDSAGTYYPTGEYPWTGASDITALGSASTTCYSASGAWTANSSSVNGATTNIMDATSWFNSSYSANCGFAAPIYCLQQ